MNREMNSQTGWDRRCNRISVSFNHKTGEIHIAANPRLTDAVFHGQYVKVSLFERNELETGVAKILHAWLCSNIRLGRALGNGNKVHPDTIAPHVWGGAAWARFGASDRSKKRDQLRAALHEIADQNLTCMAAGWLVHRPDEQWASDGQPPKRAINRTESGCETPSEYHDLTQAPA